MQATIHPLTLRPYSPRRVIALRAALLREATTGATPGLALALLVALRPSQGDQVCGEKAAKVARLPRTRVHKWTPKQVTALRLALLAEAQSGDYAGLAMACLVTLRPTQGEMVCAEKAARLAEMLHTVDNMRGLCKRIDERLRQPESEVDG